MPVPPACRESMERARRMRTVERSSRASPMKRETVECLIRAEARDVRAGARAETRETVRALCALRRQEEAGLLRLAR